MSDSIRMIAVSTVPATIIDKGMIQITASTKATTDKATGKKKEIPQDQRSRSIIIPEFTPNVSSKYISIVTTALMETAKQQLSAQWKDDPMLREVQAAQYTEDALLGYAARQAESKRLSADSIVAWWNDSALKQQLCEKYNDKQLAQFVTEIQHIAAPSIQWSEEKCLRRIATLGTCEEDTENEVCAAMIRRLNNKIEQIKKEREAIGSTEELDL